MFCWVWRQLWRRPRRCGAEGKISDTGTVVGPQWIWRIGSYRNTEIILFTPTDLFLMILQPQLHHAAQTWIMQCRGFIMVYHFSMRGLWKRRHARRVNVWSEVLKRTIETSRRFEMECEVSLEILKSHKVKICVHLELATLEPHSMTFSFQLRQRHAVSFCTWDMCSPSWMVSTGPVKWCLLDMWKGRHDSIECKVDW